ncbi:hypothetical protein NRB20_59050 [Nocardia sp. RB20]|uniref:Uncharacterized protein n=1 Tax=Nocardia macrotermitis TaxID=2585198 RepID=A0A7K0DAH8_9NOCA|nr:hypothetical protein [Nocardia macrotermitis]
MNAIANRMISIATAATEEVGKIVDALRRFH